MSRLYRERIDLTVDDDLMSPSKRLFLLEKRRFPLRK